MALRQDIVKEMGHFSTHADASSPPGTSGRTLT